MAFIADIMLAAGALGAAFYCLILGRRLRKFNNLQNGMGGAVAVLSAQVDDLEKTLNAAKKSAAESQANLEQLTTRAEDVRRQLEIQIASVHDLVPTDRTASTNQVPAELRPAQQPTSEIGEPMFSRRRSAGG